MEQSVAKGPSKKDYGRTYNIISSTIYIIPVVLTILKVLWSRDLSNWAETLEKNNSHNFLKSLIIWSIEYRSELLSIIILAIMLYLIFSIKQKDNNKLFIGDMKYLIGILMIYMYVFKIFIINYRFDNIIDNLSILIIALYFIYDGRHDMYSTENEVDKDMKSKLVNQINERLKIIFIYFTIVNIIIIIGFAFLLNGNKTVQVTSSIILIIALICMELINKKLSIGYGIYEINDFYISAKNKYEEAEEQEDVNFASNLLSAYDEIDKLNNKVEALDKGVKFSATPLGIFNNLLVYLNNSKQDKKSLNLKK